MKRTWLVLFTIGLTSSLVVLGACSSDDDGPGAAPTATAVADIIDNDVPDDSLDDGEDTSDDAPPNSITLSDLAGDWTGVWNNDTFGSSAPMSLSITVNDDGSASLTFDLFSSDLGAPFGLTPPGPITLSGTHDAAGLLVDVRDHELLGDMVAFISIAGRLQADATMDGVPEIFSLSVLGTFTKDGMDVEYGIVFSDGTSAQGTATLTRE